MSRRERLSTSAAIEAHIVLLTNFDRYCSVEVILHYNYKFRAAEKTQSGIGTTSSATPFDFSIRWLVFRSVCISCHIPADGLRGVGTAGFPCRQSLILAIVCRALLAKAFLASLHILTVGAHLLYYFSHRWIFSTGVRSWEWDCGWFLVWRCFEWGSCDRFHEWRVFVWWGSI
jgi:hypothetical protein